MKGIITLLICFVLIFSVSVASAWTCKGAGNGNGVKAAATCKQSAGFVDKDGDGDCDNRTKDGCAYHNKSGKDCGRKQLYSSESGCKTNVKKGRKSCPYLNNKQGNEKESIEQ